MFTWMNDRSTEYGRARGALIRAEYKVKRVRARLILSSPETSDERRKAWAESQDEYAIACEDHADAEEQWETMKEARSKWELMAEAWRSINANDRGMMRATR